MHFTDFMIIKFIVIVVLAFIAGAIRSGKR